MKQNELPLRDRIVAHLKNTGEATAAAIAEAVGMADIPSRVAKELNAMRTDALLEVERKGKGPGLTYWLAVEEEQGRVSIVIECDKNAVDAVKSAVRAAGGKTK